MPLYQQHSPGASRWVPRTLTLKLTSFPGSALHRADLDRALQALDRVFTLRWRVLVSDHAGIVEIRNRLGDEPIIQLLRIVDLMAARITARMEVTDPLIVIADVAHDVAVHNLRVIDVV